MKKIFNNQPIRWRTVLLFAAAVGLYTGLVMLIPILKDTSFQDIGIFYEWWVIFAVLLVCKCRTGLEAMCKCFVFFLVSQPLVYAVQVLFGSLDFQTALGYYLHIWLPATLLTAPGGFVAFYCKKQNLLGSVILGLGNTIQTVLGVSYVIRTVHDFPHHLLSAVVCFGSVVGLSFAVQKQNRFRIAAIALPIVLSAALIAFVKWRGLYLVSNIF